MPTWILAVRKFLGKLTDILTLGRAAGWWDKTQGPEIPKK